MNIEKLMKKIECIINSLMLRKGKFTGKLTLEINFFEGEPKDIVSETLRERIKL